MPYDSTDRDHAVPTVLNLLIAVFIAVLTVAV